MATTPTADLEIDLGIGQADADDLIRQSVYVNMLDDHSHDPERFGHVYWLDDGRVVLVVRGPTLVCVDPLELD